jgi:hypothetical protein
MIGVLRADRARFFSMSRVCPASSSAIKVTTCSENGIRVGVVTAEVARFRPRVYGLNTPFGDAPSKYRDRLPGSSETSLR